MRHLFLYLHHHHFHILGILFAGLVIGAVAKLFIPGKNPGGCITTTLLGIAGAVVGAILGRLLGFGNFISFVGAIFGAMFLLLVYRVAIIQR